MFSSLRSTLTTPHVQSVRHVRVLSGIHGYGFEEVQFCVSSVDPDSNLLSTELEALEHRCATHISKTDWKSSLMYLNLLFIRQWGLYKEVKDEIITIAMRFYSKQPRKIPHCHMPMDIAMMALGKKQTNKQTVINHFQQRYRIIS